MVACVEAYHAQILAGQRPDRGQLLQQFPELESELRTCLDGLEFLHCVAPQLKGPAGGLAPHSAGEPLGDFRLIREIGRGGMGVVYEAEQRSLSRRVALKILPFAAVLDQRQLQRFKNEAVAAGTLEHPNIVPVYSVGCERGVHYYAMRLVDGQSLAEALAQLQQTRSAGHETQDQDPSASPTQQTDTQPIAALTTKGSTDSPAYSYTVARLGIQAAWALQHAHQAGLMHRDIKPSNLLINHGTASELADDLQRLLENKPIQARRTGRLDHLWRWAKRKPAVAVLSATVLALLLLLAIAGPLVAIKQTSLISDVRRHSSIQAALVRETRRSLYVADVNCAYQAWEEGEPEATRLWDLTRGKQRVLRDDTCSVFSAAFSSSGDILITGGQQIDSEQGQLTLWDTYTGRELGKMIGHQKSVYSLASSPVGDIAASGDEMGVVKVWDLSV